MREMVLLSFVLTIYGVAYVSAAPAATINGMKTQELEDTRNINIEAKVITEKFHNNDGVRTSLDLHAFKPAGSSHANMMEELRVEHLDGDKNLSIEKDILVIKENSDIKIFNKTKKVKKLKKVRKIRKSTDEPNVITHPQTNTMVSKETNPELNNNNVLYDGVVDDAIYFPDDFEALLDTTNKLESNTINVEKLMSGNLNPINIENHDILEIKDNTDFNKDDSKAGDEVTNESNNEKDDLLTKPNDESDAIESNTDVLENLNDKSADEITNPISQDINKSTIDSQEIPSNSVTVEKNSKFIEEPEDYIQYSEPEDSIEFSNPEDSVNYSESEVSIEISVPENSIQTSVHKDSIQTSVPEGIIQSSEPEDFLQTSVSEESIQSSEIEDTIKSSEPENSIHSSGPEDASAFKPESFEIATHIDDADLLEMDIINSVSSEEKTESVEETDELLFLESFNSKSLEKNNSEEEIDVFPTADNQIQSDASSVSAETVSSVNIINTDISSSTQDQDNNDDEIEVLQSMSETDATLLVEQTNMNVNTESLNEKQNSGSKENLEDSKATETNGSINLQLNEEDNDYGVVSSESNDTLDPSFEIISEELNLQDSMETVTSQTFPEIDQNSHAENTNLHSNGEVADFIAEENVKSQETLASNYNENVNFEPSSNTENNENIISINENNDSLESSIANNSDQLFTHENSEVVEVENQEKNVYESNDISMINVIQNDKDNTKEVYSFEDSKIEEDSISSSSIYESEKNSDSSEKPNSLKEASLTADDISNAGIIHSHNSESIKSVEIFDKLTSLNQGEITSENIADISDLSLESSEEENAVSSDITEDLDISASVSASFEKTAEEHDKESENISELSVNNFGDHNVANSDSILQNSEIKISKEINQLSEEQFASNIESESQVISTETQSQQDEIDMEEQTVALNSVEHSELLFSDVENYNDENVVSEANASNENNSESAVQYNEEQEIVPEKHNSLEVATEEVSKHSEENVSNNIENINILPVDLTANDNINSKDTSSNNNDSILESISTDNDDDSLVVADHDETNDTLSEELLQLVEVNENSITSNIVESDKTEEKIETQEEQSIENLDIPASKSTEYQETNANLDQDEQHSNDISLLSSSEAFEETGQYISDIEIPHSSFEYSDYFDAFEGNNNNINENDLSLNVEVESKFSTELDGNTGDFINELPVSSHSEAQENDLTNNIIGDISNSDSEINVVSSQEINSNAFNEFNMNNDNNENDLSLNVEVASKFSNELDENTGDFINELPVSSHSEEQENDLTNNIIGDVSNNESLINVVSSQETNESEFTAELINENNSDNEQHLNNDKEEATLSQNDISVSNNIIPEKHETDLNNLFDEVEKPGDIKASSDGDEIISSKNQEELDDNELPSNEINIIMGEAGENNLPENEKIVEKEQSTPDNEENEANNLNETENPPKRKKVKKLKKRPKPKVPKTPEFMELLEYDEPMILNPSFLKPAMPVPVMYRPEYRRPV